MIYILKNACRCISVYVYNLCVYMCYISNTHIQRYISISVYIVYYILLKIHTYIYIYKIYCNGLNSVIS